MKKLTLILAILALGIAFTTSSAMAFSLGGYTGLVKFKFNNWDYGTLYAPGTNNPADGVASGNTDSYGIFTVTSITDLVGNNLWNQTPGESLEGWFYGLSDDGEVFDGTGSGNIWSMGGKLEMYLGPRNLDPTAGPGVVPALPSAPTDIWNVTDGALFLSADFVPGAVFGDPTTTLFGTISSITVPISGKSEAYLEVTGGSHASMFNSNIFQGGAADLFLQNDFKSGDVTDPGFGWTAVSHDPVLGKVVPEPSTMILFGMGIMGLATRLRRKKVA